MQKKLFITLFLIVMSFIFIGYSVLSSRQDTKQKAIKIGTEIIVDKNNFNYCENNRSCVWYVENQGDPAGQIHCAGVNYSKTCSS